MLYPSRLKQSGGSTGGTEVYIDGVKSSASRVDLDELIMIPVVKGSSGAIVFYNNEMHFLGSSLSPMTQHYKWDGSSWSSVSTLPYKFFRGSAVVYNNEIHIFGGNYQLGVNTQHYKWDGSSWSSVSTLPYDIDACNVVVYNNEIHILGSEVEKTAHYKWNGSTWSSVSTLPYDFMYGSAVVYNNEIHILGGLSSNSTKHYKWNTCP